MGKCNKAGQKKKPPKYESSFWKPSKLIRNPRIPETYQEQEVCQYVGPFDDQYMKGILRKDNGIAEKLNKLCSLFTVQNTGTVFSK